tara:strand:- start:15 stop:527 length:513 start_codon:yes stop_codon:yes gene_type:complete
MSDPKTVKVKARDVVPYLYGVWSFVADGEPFANQIMRIRWSEDGEHLWFGLDSHNFMKARPDEVLELVPMEPRGMLAKKKANEWVLPPQPKPEDKMLETAQDQIKKTIAACGNPRDWSLEQIGDEITFSYVCPGDTEPTEFAGSSLREVLDAAASPRNVVDLSTKEGRSE